VETAVSSAFTPVLAKHSNSLSLIDCISVGVESYAAEHRTHAKVSESLAEKRTDGFTVNVVIY
jgi:hypothetical protein